jgi:Ca2+/H+ antiporter
MVKLQLVAVTADRLVESMDTIAQANRYVSKEWMGLILLPTVRVIAGAFHTSCMLARANRIQNVLPLSTRPLRIN